METHSAPSSRLLIVESDLPGVESLTLLLELSGFSVGVCEDGWHAIARACAESITAILVEAGNLGMELPVFVRHIRNATAYRPLLLVILSRKSGAQHHKAILQAGFDCSLVKGDDLKEFLQFLEMRRGRNGNEACSDDSSIDLDGSGSTDDRSDR